MMIGDNTAHDAYNTGTGIYINGIADQTRKSQIFEYHYISSSLWAQ